MGDTHVHKKVNDKKSRGLGIGRAQEKARNRPGTGLHPCFLLLFIFRLGFFFLSCMYANCQLPFHAIGQFPTWQVSGARYPRYPQPGWHKLVRSTGQESIITTINTSINSNKNKTILFCFHPTVFVFDVVHVPTSHVSFEPLFCFLFLDSWFSFVYAHVRRNSGLRLQCVAFKCSLFCSAYSE